MSDRAPETEPSTEEARPRASVLGSFALGWRRAIGAPWVIAGMLAATFLLAWPLALAIEARIGTRFGPVLDGSDVVARTFVDGLLGFDATAALVGRMPDDAWLSLPTAAAVCGYLLVWVFLSGGALDRLARGRRVGTGPFFSACGTYGVRFVRLDILVAAAFWILFRWLQPFLLTTVYDRWAPGLGSTGTNLAQVALLVIFATTLAFASLIVGFARVRVVVEDRHSVLSALAASLRFVRRRWWRCLLLYLLNAAAFVAIVGLSSAATDAVAGMPWVETLLSAGGLLIQLLAMLAFMASEAVFFQGELAHAHYTAAPLPTWPDSPAAEAIRNLTRSG